MPPVSPAPLFDLPAWLRRWEANEADFDTLVLLDRQSVLYVTAYYRADHNRLMLIAEVLAALAATEQLVQDREDRPTLTACQLAARRSTQRAWLLLPE